MFSLYWVYAFFDKIVRVSNPKYIITIKNVNSNTSATCEIVLSLLIELSSSKYYDN